MNIDSLGYVILTAAVGMAVVFFALVFLSLMMLAIRIIFADRSTGKLHMADITEDSHSEQYEPAPGDTDQDGIPLWAIAGAVLYVFDEEGVHAPLASPWITQRLGK